MSLWSERTGSSWFCSGELVVWGSFFPVLDQEVCMPNWSLAAGGDWLYYKEATTVSCWCLTCKSCRSKHTPCRSRQHCVGPRRDACITSTYAMRAHCLSTYYSKKKNQTCYFSFSQSHTFLCLYCMLIWLLNTNAGKSLWPEKGQDIIDEDKDLSKKPDPSTHRPPT